MGEDTKKVWCEECGSLGVRHKKGCSLLVEKVENNVDLEKCTIHIENLGEVTEKVKDMMVEKLANPSVVHEGDAGIAFKDGEPHIIIENEYVPVDKAQIILQTQVVVRENLKLTN